MRHLVTGGAGFIGSHLVGRLLSRGDEVVCLDDFNAFYDPTIKRRNIVDYLDNPGFRLVEGDICDVDAVDRAFAAGPFDRLVHLAARAGVRPSIVEPALYYRVNCEGTVNLLEAAHRAGVDRVVFASSSSVYGSNESVPFRETDNVDNPVSPYAATKKAGELLCHAYHHLYGMHLFCLRFFTVYGPRQRPEMAIHRFIDLLSNGQPVPMFGDGTSSRDYTYVDDIIDGVLRAIDRVEGYRVYNIGESRTVQLRELIEIIAAAVGVTPNVKPLPFQAGDVVTTYADISRMKTELGYDPRTPIEEGIRKMVAWYRGERGERG